MWLQFSGTAMTALFWCQNELIKYLQVDSERKRCLGTWAGPHARALSGQQLEEANPLAIDIDMCETHQQNSQGLHSYALTPRHVCTWPSFQSQPNGAIALQDTTPKNANPGRIVNYNPGRLCFWWQTEKEREKLFKRKRGIFLIELDCWGHTKRAYDESLMKVCRLFFVGQFRWDSPDRYILCTVKSLAEKNTGNHLSFPFHFSIKDERAVAD